MKSRRKADKHRINAQFNPAEAVRELQALPGYVEQSDLHWWRDFVGKKYLRVFGFTNTSNGKQVPIRLTQVLEQLSFKDVEPTSADDVATYRTARELFRRQSFGTIPLVEFWKIETADHSLVQLAQRRWSAYREAYLKAKAYLDKTRLPFKLSEVVSPADALYNLNTGQWNTSLAEKLADKLSPADRQMMSTPEKMADPLAKSLRIISEAETEALIRRTHLRTKLLPHLNFMLRVAAGLVGEFELAAFFLTFFPPFSLDEKLLFLRYCRCKPKMQRQNLLVIKSAWLIHNAPVFAEFGWQWSDICQALFKKLNAIKGINAISSPIPEDYNTLKQYCSRHSIHLGLSTKPRKSFAPATHFSSKLLTELPALSFR